MCAGIANIIIKYGPIIKKKKKKKPTRPTLFENFMLLQYNNFFFFGLSYYSQLEVARVALKMNYPGQAKPTVYTLKKFATLFATSEPVINCNISLQLTSPVAWVYQLCQ